MHHLAGQTEFPRLACGGFVLRKPAQQQHQRGWRLMGLGKGSSRQQRVIAIAIPAVIGGKVLLLVKEATICPTAGNAPRGDTDVAQAT